MSDDTAIAVVGMYGRFPGAANLAAFWQNIVDGREAIRFFSKAELSATGLDPARLDDPSFVAARAWLDEADKFDADFFGVGAREAELTDPQHRLFLEACWGALENAAILPERVDYPIGVFGGCSMNTYYQANLASEARNFDTLAGTQAALNNDKDFLTTRVSYKLNLTGPSMTVLSACSTGLAAIHAAVTSLLAYQCDAALAGAASVTPPLMGGHQHQQGMLYSVDGRCRPYDAEATGTVAGDGVGVVVLRRLEDALADGDPIRAIIRGIALNNDGGNKVGPTAPSVNGQAEVIALAQGLADVSPDSLAYLEGHGTATPLGDPIEVAAATQAFREETERVGYCGLGSVKANIGHLNAAAGIASFIKTVLALENKTLPPSPNFKVANPALKLDTSPFYVVTEATPWPSWNVPARAAVSSFGAGGTNVHAIVEASPAQVQASAVDSERGDRVVLPISARSDASADAACQTLAEDLKHLVAEESGVEENSAVDLETVAATLRDGRRSFSHRRAVIATDIKGAIAALSRGEVIRGHAVADTMGQGSRPVVFAFPAQGGQMAGAGRGLYDAEPIFRTAMEACFAALAPWVPDLGEVMFSTEDSANTLDDQYYAGAAMFSLGYSLAALWRARGVEPDVVIGHSTGEYAAACVAGLLTLEQATTLLMLRAEALRVAPPASVLLVGLSATDMSSRLAKGCYLALDNAPQSCVVVGDAQSITELEALLQDQEVFCRRLRLSLGAHSPLLGQAVSAFDGAIKDISEKFCAKDPEVRYLSATTGEWITAGHELSVDYWVRHMQMPVQFTSTLAKLTHELSGACALEMGPNRSLSVLLSLNVPEMPVVHALPPAAEPALLEPDAAAKFDCGARAELWTLGGADLDLITAHGEHKPRHVALSATPFDRRRYWIDPPGVQSTAASGSASAEQQSKSFHPRPELGNPFVAPSNRVECVIAEIAQDALGVAPIGVEDNFVELGANSLITLRMHHEIQQRLGRPVPTVAIFSGFTVAALAEHFTDDDVAEVTHVKGDNLWQEKAMGKATSRVSSVIALRTTGTRPPLFLAHPACGVVFPYFDLVRELGVDQPVYAFQAVGLDGQMEPDETVEEMSARYVADMKSVQPKGPYRIGGFSFGCYITYEMTRQLLEMGEEVDFVGLIDELAPIDGIRPGARHLMRLILSPNTPSVLRHVLDYKNHVAAGRKSGQQIGLRQWLNPNRVLERLTMATLAPPKSEFLHIGAEGALTKMFELFVLHCKATLAYSPPPIACRGTVIKSEYWNHNAFYLPKDRPNLGWDLLCEGGVDVLFSTGDHIEMVRDPHARSLAQAITSALSTLDQQYADQEYGELNAAG